MKIFPVFFFLLIAVVGCNQPTGNLLYRDLSECNQVAEIKQVGNHKVVVCNPDLLKDMIVLPLSYFTGCRFYGLLNSFDDFTPLLVH